ncbi:MAG: response regulator [Betaproteobacteria bacterium]|nr:response regulator [Betaproteobacteria bacterium]
MSVTAETGGVALPRVLLVEDDDDARRAVAAMLDHLGMQVWQAQDAASAYELLGEMTPDIAIVDVMMNGVPEGFDVCWKIKTTLGLHESYVVLLTGRGEPQDLEFGKERGADLYLVKPLDLHMLAEIIGRLGLLVKPGH